MNIGFIGCGNMTHSILSGMLSSDFVSDDIMVQDICVDAMQRITTKFGVVGTSLETMVHQCKIIILAVKPQHINQLSTELKPYLGLKPTIVSILAGISTQKLALLLEVPHIIRVMPNTPAMIGKSASVLFTTTNRHLVVERIFKSIGIALWVEKETDIDIATALSGSGPAYFFSLFAAMITTATQMGMDKDMARQLCLHTAIGAAELALISGEELATLQHNVSSKGGTTEAALQSLNDDKVSSIMARAMQQALKRAKELAAK